MDCQLQSCLDRQIVADLYLSRSGAEFVEDLVNGYGARFGGTKEEQAAAEFIRAKLESFGVDRAWTEPFQCMGWTRKGTELTVVSPVEQAMDCIALPFCPPGTVEAPLVFLGDGDPQTYADNRERLKGAVVMVTTATPRYYHRSMHRGEKLGRALEAGAIGFIWMRGEPGGLPETGSARFNRACEVPCISVSFETGQEMLRLGRQGELKVRITSTNEVHPVTSYNVIGEITGRKHPEEIIVIGGHYDGHDINQSANDNGAGVAVVVEAARALAAHKEKLDRTIRFVGFAQEEMGLIGSETYVKEHLSEKHVFMINTDGAGRGTRASLSLQNWSENTAFFKQLFAQMLENQVSVGDSVSLYSDMFNFASVGIPSSTYTSSDPVSGGAPRGYGHTYWDTLDKVNPKGIQGDAIILARLLLRLATVDVLPMKHKTAEEFGRKLRQLGFDEILRYETRAIPGDK